MDIALINTVNKRKFRRMTRVGRKPRRLVIDPVFKSMITRFVDGGTLQSEFEKIHFLDDSFQIGADVCYSFIIPPDIPTVKRVLECRMRVAKSASTSNLFIELWFQPRINDLVASFLVDVGVAPASLLASFPSRELSVNAINEEMKKPPMEPQNGIEIYNLELDVLPLDNDVMTTFSPYSFVRGWYFHDLTIIDEVKQGLELAVKSGGFLSITTVGTLATALGKTLPPPNDLNPTHLIVIDRATDLITPMITQMNYEGLIAEYLGINCGLVASRSNSGQMQLLSSESDQLYTSLRWMNHQEASDEISRRMSTVSNVFTKQDTPLTHNMEEGLAKFKETAKVSLENQTLIDHINLYQTLLEKMKSSRYFKQLMNIEADILSAQSYKAKDMITDMLEFGTDLQTVLRLMCLDSMWRQGSQDFTSYLHSLTFNHGFQMVPFVARLQEMGLFGPPTTGHKWKSLINTFQVYSPNWQEKDDQAAASYLGYAPLSVRYIERVIDGDFQTVQKAMGDINQKCAEKGRTEWRKTKGNYLICYIGGCTHSELNSIRRIADRRGMNIQVLTTDLFSSNEFFDHIAKDIPGYNPKLGNAF